MPQVENLRYAGGSHMILAIECVASESRLAVRPRANRAGGGVWWSFTPRLTALGLYKRPRNPQ